MINLYNIDSEYTELLRNNVDAKVNKNNNNNYKRVYCGIIVSDDNTKFFIPMTHNTNDNPKLSKTVFKLKDKKNNQKNSNLGMLLFNNAIPLKEGTYSKIELKITENDSIENIKYKILMQKQIKTINALEKSILYRFNDLMNRAKQGKLTRIEKDRMCNFDKMVKYVNSPTFENTTFAKKIRNKVLFVKQSKKETQMNEYLKKCQKGLITPKQNNNNKVVSNKKSKSI